MVFLNDYFPQLLHHNAYQLSRDVSLGCSQFAHHYYGNHFVFFSSRYLDVSVHAVCFVILYIQITILWVYHSGFPHSETFGSKLSWQLPEAYGSLLPPSSPSDAKASTKYPFQLITILKNSINWTTIDDSFKLQTFQRSQETFYRSFIHKLLQKKLRPFQLIARQNLVEMSGVEPLTFRVQSGRSTNWATSPHLLCA